MISSAILSGNFPTLVPPNFWTIHPLRLSFRTSWSTIVGDSHHPRLRDETKGRDSRVFNGVVGDMTAQPAEPKNCFGLYVAKNC